MFFQCNRCLKYFDTKYHYNQHLIRKIPCKENNNKILDHDSINIFGEESTDNKLSQMDNTVENLDNLLSKFDNKLSNENYQNIEHIIDDNPLKCLLCNRVYKHLSGLCKHKTQKHPNYKNEILIIKNKQYNEIDEKSEIEKLKELFMTQIENLNEKNKKLDNKNKELELLVKTSKTKNITKNITNNTNNTNNGTINNINIVQFGREDSSLLNKEEISKILYERGIDGLLASIEVFHFNNRLPQYKNIRLTNLKSKYIDIHDGNKWKKENQEKILNETLENHIYHLQTICDEKGNPKKIKNSVKNIIKDYLEVNKFDTEEKKITNNKKTIKKVSDKKEEVKLFVYNNSKLEEDNILMDV